MNNIPFVEKYRPDNICDIVLNSHNRILFNNIIKNKEFPNMLLYGPPGTGKTTTIIALIKEFNKKNNINNYETIHLNASDDRGIENMRSIILKFTNTCSLFDNKYKFIVLDEVDYMTEQAQLCLKIMMESNTRNVKFCLICNYIKKINLSLANKFIKIYFKTLDKRLILNKINIILKKENITCSKKATNVIINKFNSDLRSIINYIQLNSYTLHKHKTVSYDNIINCISLKPLKNAEQYLFKVSKENNISVYELIHNSIFFFLNTRVVPLSSINIFKLLLHNNINITYMTRLFVIEIKSVV